MRSSISDPIRLKRAIEAKARALGFDAMRITPADLDPEIAQRLAEFLAAGRHGTMAWLADTFARRQHPKAMWPNARSAIVLGMNYGPVADPRGATAPDTGVISVYARGRDYHDVIKGKLKELASLVASQTGAEVKVFVDTAPLMEKPLAMAAGLGWQGKHTNLVSREFGSWLFLGVILSAADLPTDEAQGDVCGSCRACLDACPTNAFPAPYQIDARRCISYLTIEHAGPIEPALRVAMGNRIYGCDDCLAACPWNKFAQIGRETKLAAREDLAAPSLADLVSLDDAAFRAKFAGSPIKRIGRDRFIRNVLIAIANTADPSHLNRVKILLADPSPLVRAMAVWACRSLMTPAGFADLAQVYRADERDGDVQAEWDRGLAEPAERAVA